MSELFNFYTPVPVVKVFVEKKEYESLKAEVERLKQENENLKDELRAEKQNCDALFLIQQEDEKEIEQLREALKMISPFDRIEMEEDGWFSCGYCVFCDSKTTSTHTDDCEYIKLIGDDNT